MPDYTVKDRETGQTVTFRWTGAQPPTDADMADVFRAARTQAPPPTPEPTGAVDRLSSLLSGAKDVGIGMLKGAGDTALGLGQLVHQIPGVSGAVDRLYGAPGLSNQAFQVYDKELEATNPAQMVGKGVEFLAEAAIPVTAGVKALPTTAKAGKKFETVMKAAHARPVDVSRAGDVALRIQELADRGGSMPMVVRKFLKRITDPAQGDLTYKEGRDFYHNISRLSANEFQRLTPVIQREVSALRVALNQALERTASGVGKGDDYSAAMKEYRRAARLREMGEATANAGKKAAITGAIGGTAYGIAKGGGLLD